METLNPYLNSLVVHLMIHYILPAAFVSKYPSQYFYLLSRVRTIINRLILRFYLRVNPTPQSAQAGTDSRPTLPPLYDTPPIPPRTAPSYPPLGRLQSLPPTPLSPYPPIPLCASPIRGQRVYCVRTDTIPSKAQPFLARWPLMRSGPLSQVIRDTMITSLSEAVVLSTDVVAEG